MLECDTTCSMHVFVHECKLCVHDCVPMYTRAQYYMPYACVHKCGATVCECDSACVPMCVRLHVYEYEEIVYESMCVHA